MRHVRLIFNLMAVVVLTLTVSSLAQAQATRTFVSGVGDDNNPCSRTAPCRTFAAALSHTAAGGEIDALDPGGYGALNVTKSITIDGGGTYASILASGVIGVIVNDSGSGSPNTAVVTLRNLAISGGGDGIQGVRILSAKSVSIENCQIYKFRGTNGSNPGRAISEERTSAGAKLTVINTTMTDNSANAVVINFNQAGASTTAVFDNVRVYDNSGSGIFAGSGAKVTIRNSTITANANAGVVAADANTKMNVVDSVVSHNTNFGVFAGSGTSIIRLTGCTITENGAGISESGGTVESFGDNSIRGNGSGNTGATNFGQQ